MANTNHKAKTVKINSTWFMMQVLPTNKSWRPAFHWKGATPPQKTVEHTGTPHSFKHGPDLQIVNRTTAQQINLTSVYNYILHISMQYLCISCLWCCIHIFLYLNNIIIYIYINMLNIHAYSNSYYLMPWYARISPIKNSDFSYQATEPPNHLSRHSPFSCPRGETLAAHAPAHQISADFKLGYEPKLS